MILPRSAAQPEDIEDQFNALAPFPPGVVNVRYTLDEDWTGDPAIFFWATLSDEAVQRPERHQNCRRITDHITERLDPLGQWGLFPYFYFRSQSEQAKLKDPAYG